MRPGINQTSSRAILFAQCTMCWKQGWRDRHGTEYTIRMLQSGNNENVVYPHWLTSDLEFLCRVTP
jgi:hypothetical protein